MMITPTSFNAPTAVPAAAPAAAATLVAPAPAVAPAAPTQVARPATAPASTAAAAAGDAVAKVAQANAAREAVAALNKRLEPMDTSVRFELDSSTGKTVITMLDTDNNNVLRQFPSDETLAMIRALDHQQGLLINTQS